MIYNALHQLKENNTTEQLIKSSNRVLTKEVNSSNIDLTLNETSKSNLGDKIMSKVAKKVSKAEAARRLYKRLKNRSRQNVLPRLIEKVGMSKACASTYFNNLRVAEKEGKL